MESVRINKANLLEVIKENRTKHRSIVEEAMAKYRAAAIAELDAMLDDARAGRKIRRSLTLIEPVDQTRDYDRIIRMLEMSEDSVIELHEEQFKCYVEDDWSWKRQFLASNRTYIAKLGQDE